MVSNNITFTKTSLSKELDTFPMPPKNQSEAQPPSAAAFRRYLPDLSSPRFTSIASHTPYTYTAQFLSTQHPPWLYGLYKHWRALFAQPYKGVTNDGGAVRPDLYRLEDEGVEVDKIVAAAEAILSLANEAQRQKICLHVDSPEWRTWSNPEFLLSNKGVRLEELEPTLIASILKLLETSLSPEGYDKAIGAMRVNGYLGELVNAPAIMNEHSYNFVLFGTPSSTRPWGFQFFGHHLCLNIFIYKNQIIVAPWFTGAEPNFIDDGPWKGTRILHEEEKLGLALMQSLPGESQAKAQIFKLMHDPAMEPGRWNRDDQRHLCGAYNDNRICPYEGVLASSFTSAQRELAIGIFEQYLLYLPTGSRKAKIAQIKERFDETYFCWIGPFDNEAAFYFRLQSPVIVVEFDHHSGVFLTNTHPQPFHIHTVLRYPNAGDYGMALRKQIPVEERIFEKIGDWPFG